MRNLTSYQHDDSGGEFLIALYRRHVMGALVRSGASAIMWLCALAAYLIGLIHLGHLTGISSCVLYLILINPPTLFLLKRITRLKTYRYGSLFINFLEILGYTGIIYFLGGIEAAYLTPLYAALITYVGVVAPWRFPYVIASLCSLALSSMVAGIQFGLLPEQTVISNYHVPWTNQVVILIAITGLLFVIAYISSVVGNALRRGRDQLREQNLALRTKTAALEEAHRDLEKARDELEERVYKRTEELKKANERLEAEIIERRRTEEILRESEQKYRLHFEHVSDVVFTMDRGLIIRSVSPSVQRVLGYAPKDLLGSRLTDLSLLAPDHHQKVLSDITRVLSGERIDSAQYEFITKAGHGKSVEVSSASLLVDGKITGVISVARDLSERQEMERQRQRLESRLAEARKTLAIATLAGGVAHQFNNALSIITGGLSLLRWELSGGKALRYAEMMESAATRMIDLTQQLLAYARGGIYEARVICMTDFLKNTLPLVEPTLSSPVKVTMDLGDGIFPVKVDVTQLQMVLSALLSNASEAIEDKGVIRVTCNNEWITEEGARNYDGLGPGPHVRLTIEDNGKGMDEETLSRVFEPFFSTKFQGRGLGLAAVYGIVKGHGGWISVRSEPGKGTAVDILLPACPEAGETGPKPTRKETLRARGTALLIDDEDQVCEVGKALLERLGYQVLCARTGEEAVHVARTYEGAIDLALLDVLLPDMNGQAVYSVLMDARPNLKVLVCSGYTQDGPAEAILQAGAQGFLQKPFSLEELASKLETIS